MNCKLKLHSKGFYQQILGAVTVLKFLQKLALDFPYICLQFFPGNFYKQMYRKLKKKVLGLLESLRVKLYFTVHIFFKTAVLRKFFDIGFSNKHCDFSRVCLLVKMASKTVTRSIAQHVFSQHSLGIGQLHDDVILLQLPEFFSLLFSCAN